jgi:O-antigen ligase
MPREGAVGTVADTRTTASSLAASQTQSEARVRQVIAWYAFLVLLLWGGYNTGIDLLLAPDFPANTLQLVHGLRSLLPLLAGWLALIALLGRGKLKPWAAAGPLGMMAAYAATGLISSLLVSDYPGLAAYWGCMFLAVVLVMAAAASQEQPLRVLRGVMTASWWIDIVFMLGLLGAIPFLGSQALVPSPANPLGVVAYGGQLAASGTLLGMPSTRSTGFARYGAVAGIVALGRLWHGGLARRTAWLIMLGTALFVLLICQARTETVGFLAGALSLLAFRRSRRVVLLGAGTIGVVLLWLVGFFRGLWEFGTKGGSFDPTLTGRTAQWMEGLHATMQSPWLGLGFQADRFYVHGVQMENALVHALIQSGVLGTVFFVAGFVMSWWLLARIYISGGARLVPDEVPGILMFFTVMSFTESTAFYGANWMLLAPVLTYLQTLAWLQRSAARQKVAAARRSHWETALTA